MAHGRRVRAAPLGGDPTLEEGDVPIAFRVRLLRLCYRVHRLLFKKPIWIFGDKEWKAGDNAENVYRYA